MGPSGITRPLCVAIATVIGLVIRTLYLMEHPQRSEGEIDVIDKAERSIAETGNQRSALVDVVLVISPGVAETAREYYNELYAAGGSTEWLTIGLFISEPELKNFFLLVRINFLEST